MRRPLTLIALLLASLSLLALPVQAQEDTVLVAEVDGAITPVVSEYLREAVETAEEGGYEALVVRLDTPGGLDISTREIVQSFLNAEVPVIVYVSPSGARAASAGTFITMAANVAAMAPGTSIGAATPVDLQGGEISDKVINDSAAFAVAVAEERGRNTEFAEDAVREGTSITAEEALETGVIDEIADDLEGLLNQIDGMQVELDGGEEVELATEEAALEEYELGTFRSVLARLADPNLAFIFLSIGTLAVIYEAANPGMGFAGIAGVILLVLAFFSLSVLPVRGAGLALLILAAALFIAELFVPGVGVFAAGGTVALLLGGLFLFRGELSVSPPVLWPAALVLGVGTALAGRLAWRARKQPPATGVERLIGKSGQVQAVRGGVPQIFLEGTWWEVQPRAEEVTPADKVRVVAVEGLRLIVEPEPEGRPEEEEA